MDVLADTSPDLVDLLSSSSGLKPLPVVKSFDSPAEAARIFQQVGLVAIPGALHGEVLERLREASTRVMNAIIEHDPQGRGTNGRLRYSFGACSSTGSQLHHPEWAALLDLSAVTDVLDEIWGPGYACNKAGGDFCLSGAFSHQCLHSDVQDLGPRVLSHETAPFIAVNFLLEGQTPFNGPLRHIPRTQRQDPCQAPTLENEPQEMLLSTMCPLPAGTALIRDLRAWHGGTPNISTRPRSMPNVEFVAPTLVQPRTWIKSMPFDIWRGLSARGQQLSRHICAAEGKEVEAYVKFVDLGLGQGDVYFRTSVPPLFKRC